MLRFMLIVSALLGLHMRIVDFTLMYTQAPIIVDIFLDLPAGFNINGNRKDYVLRLKKNLYGLKQAGLSWFEMLCDHPVFLGFKQSDSDPCFFYHDELILICYVDDCLMFSPLKEDVDLLITALKEMFVLTDKGNVSAYLGIQKEKHRDEKENEILMMSQLHLMQRILETINLMDQHLHDTPAELRKLLTKDTEGEQ